MRILPFALFILIVQTASLAHIFEGEIRQTNTRVPYISSTKSDSGSVHVATAMFNHDEKKCLFLG